MIFACLYTIENTLRQRNRAVPWPPWFCCKGSSATATRQSSSPASVQGRWTFSWRHRALPKPAGHGVQWHHPDPSEPPTSKLCRGPTKPHWEPGEERHNGLTLTDTQATWFSARIEVFPFSRILNNDGSSVNCTRSTNSNLYNWRPHGFHCFRNTVVNAGVSRYTN